MDFSALLIQFHLNAPELNEKIACGGRPVGFATASVSSELSHAFASSEAEAGVVLLATDLAGCAEVFVLPLT